MMMMMIECEEHHNAPQCPDVMGSSLADFVDVTVERHRAVQSDHQTADTFR